MFRAKKQILVLATFTSMIDAKEEALVLEHVFCIHYPIQFKKDTNKTQIRALIDSGIEVNDIYPTLVKELGFFIRSTNIGVQKIDGTMLDTYGIVVTAFLVVDKANWVRLFEKTFLVVNVSLEIVLGMFFLIFSNANIQLLEKELT